MRNRFQLNGSSDMRCLRMAPENPSATSDKVILASSNISICTRTMAAIVMGCVQFDRDVQIMGVILNRIAGARHQRILTRSIEHHSGLVILFLDTAFGYIFPEDQLENTADFIERMNQFKPS